MWLYGWEKCQKNRGKKCHLYLREGEEGVLRELQAWQPHYDPWDGDGKPNSENISKHMKEKKTSRSSQHGKSHLTEQISFYKEFTSLMDEGGAEDLVFPVFLKAFDTDPHKVLGLRSHDGRQDELEAAMCPCY